MKHWELVLCYVYCSIHESFWMRVESTHVLSGYDVRTRRASGSKQGKTTTVLAVSTRVLLHPFLAVPPPRLTAILHGAARDTAASWCAPWPYIPLLPRSLAPKSLSHLTQILPLSPTFSYTLSLSPHPTYSRSDYVPFTHYTFLNCNAAAALENALTFLLLLVFLSRDMYFKVLS